MTPAELIGTAELVVALLREHTETLKRIESQNKTIITILHSQAASNRQRSQAYSKLRKQFAESQATLSVKTELTALLKEITGTIDSVPSHEQAVVKDFRSHKQHQTRKSTK